MFHEPLVITTVMRASRESSTVGYSMLVDGAMRVCAAVARGHHPGRVHFRARDAKRAPCSQQWPFDGRIGFPMFSGGKAPWQYPSGMPLRSSGSRRKASVQCAVCVRGFASVARCIAQCRVDEFYAQHYCGRGPRLSGSRAPPRRCSQRAACAPGRRLRQAPLRKLSSPLRTSRAWTSPRGQNANGPHPGIAVVCEVALGWGSSHWLLSPSPRITAQWPNSGVRSDSGTGLPQSVLLLARFS